jgi:excisionase family DNA binding protein
MTQVSVADAAAALGVGSARVRQLIHDGRLRAGRVGKAYLVDADSLSALQKQPRRSGRPRLVVHRGSLVWDAAASSILALGQAEANRFLAALSGAELHRLGLKDAVRRYSLEEHAGDGGCDLLIEAPRSLHHRYIPGGISVWQVKSG